MQRIIVEAEKKTSGEIRLYIEKECAEEVLDRAAFIFASLDIHLTDARNGVLFYLSLVDHKYAILGDVGINIKVPENFWDSISYEMLQHFKVGKIPDGLKSGIGMAGKALAEFFPYNPDDDVNELPDYVIYN